MKSEKYNKVETMLYEYRDIDVELREIDLKMDEIKLYKGCGAMSYGERTGQTFKINNTVENEILDKEKKLGKLEFEKRRLNILKNRVENALSILNEDHKRIVELRYLSRPKESWSSISEKLNLDKSTCSDICSNKIIPELSQILFKYQ